MPDEKIDRKSSAQPQSDLKKMQQRLIDETVDESFPASDPPAWTTTGSKSVAAKWDADEAGAATAGTGTQGTSRSDQARGDGSLRAAADRASHLAQDALRTGERYLEEARRRLPEAERYYREGRSAVARPVQAYPLTAVVLAAGVGYGLAWLIHGRATPERSGNPNMPAYGRRPSGDVGRDDRSRGERGRVDQELRRAQREARTASSAPVSF